MEKIILAHGEGGKLSYNLVKDIFLSRFNNPILKRLDDSSVFSFSGKKFAITTDSYVITPIFFKGGDIGKLAITGTINDLSMSGAMPLYLTASFIIEEGFNIKDLENIVESMKREAEVCGVEIIAGDTKVVEKGDLDKIFITTTGFGIIPDGVEISSSNVGPSDVIIVSGGIGEHGIAILSEREGFSFNITSDCAPLNTLVRDMLKASKNIHILRDLTRGGLATILNEIAIQSDVGIELFEENIIIKEGVKGACELLGLDPLYIACEGRLVAFVPHSDAQAVLDTMHKNQYGRDAAIIGNVVLDHKKNVILSTLIGGKRTLDMLSGTQLPRIC